MQYQNLTDRSVIVCDIQTRGRGRLQRVWESGNDLTCSILFQHHAPFSLSIPVAIVRALSKFHIDAMIKWPNDILINDKKVCGILIETLYEGSTLLAQVVGIGINLSTPPSTLEYKATSISLDKEALLEAILQAYEELEQKEMKDILSMYRSYHYLQGRTICLNDVVWDVVDVNEDGSLMVQCGTITRILTSEEITLEQIY